MVNGNDFKNFAVKANLKAKQYLVTLAADGSRS